jgi:hypothetical protein
MSDASAEPASRLAACRGATSVEYSVIAAAVGAVVVGVALILGGVTTELLCVPLERLKTVGFTVEIDC